MTLQALLSATSCTPPGGGVLLSYGSPHGPGRTLFECFVTFRPMVCVETVVATGALITSLTRFPDDILADI